MVKTGRNKEANRVDKEIYEKYGHFTHTIFNNNEISYVKKKPLTIQFTGITAALIDIGFTIYDYDSLYTWTKSEDELTQAAAKHDIKLIFEEQLSLKTDYMNPENTINVVLEKQTKKPHNYIVKQPESYNALIKYFETMSENFYKLPIASCNDDWAALYPGSYDAGERIITALISLGGKIKEKPYEIAFYTEPSEDFICKAKKRYNLNIQIV